MIDEALELEKELARKCAGQLNMPFKIVRPDYSGGYVTCPVSVKTSCEVVWSTEDPKPELPPTPVQQEWEERIAKMQVEIEKMKGESA